MGGYVWNKKQNYGFKSRNSDSEQYIEFSAGDPLPFSLVERLLAVGVSLAELAGLSRAAAERLLEEMERRR